MDGRDGLRRAVTLLAARLLELEARLSTDWHSWPAYVTTVQALAAAVTLDMAGSSGRLLTTQELAAAMGVSSKTLLRARKRGQLQAVQLGQRGRAALRWRGPTT